MRLSSKEVERFYQIWFPLLHYVNQKRKLVPMFPEKWTKQNSVKPEDALPLREALWADDSLRQAFIRENPAKLSAGDLTLVESWQHRVMGEFFIFRYLKNFTVFLSGESSTRAYGVLGLVSSIEEIAGPYLPVYVKAVLLPFEARIIYDGLLMPYPVMFGGGVRSDLNETYRDIQEREGIITSLPPDTKAASPEDIETRNKKILKAFQKDLGQAGLSPRMMEEHTGNIAAFANDFLLSQPLPRLLLEMTVADVQVYLETQTDKSNLVSFKRFVQFLRDTGRMDWDEAGNFLNLLKQQRKR